MPIDTRYRHERSLQDAKTSNDLAKTAAQIIVLINGGAATAILAYASAIAKEGANAVPIFGLVRWALMGYAFGVLCGALMLICLAFAIEKWMIYWTPDNDNTERERKKIDRRAQMWWKTSLVCFGTAAASFFVSSILIALGA